MYMNLDPHEKEPRITLFKANDVDTGWEEDSEHVEFKDLLSGLRKIRELIEAMEVLSGFQPLEQPQQTRSPEED